MNFSSASTTPKSGLRIYLEPDSDALTPDVRVVLIDRERASRFRLVELLIELGCEVTVADSLCEAEANDDQRRTDLFVQCAYTQDEIEQFDAGIPRIVIADPALISAAAPSVATAPFLFLHAPVQGPALRIAVQRAIENANLRLENEKQSRQLAAWRTRDLVGHSPAAGRLREQIIQTADNEVDTAVFIQGEAGCGKQTAARALHDCSGRAHRPFISVDCSLMTAACLERELFGEESSGTFGGGAEHVGRLDLAAGGTLVLLNIDEMALMLQADFAEVLQERRFRRLGSTFYRPLEAHVVATSSYDLTTQARQGLFRSDLLHEIAQTELRVPPLRERLEDITALTERFLRNVSLKHGKPAKRIPTQTMGILTRYQWPGNVRELENVIERACAVDGGPKLTPEMIRPWLLSNSADTGGFETGMSLKEMERKLIESAFARFSGNREKTAQALGIGLRTLSGKLRDYGYPPRGGPGSNRTGNRAA